MMYADTTHESIHRVNVVGVIFIIKYTTNKFANQYIIRNLEYWFGGDTSDDYSER